MSPQDSRIQENKSLTLLENTFQSVDNTNLVPVLVRSCHYGAGQVLINCIGV